MHTKKETAENEELDRKGSPVCVYGDMELQERASINEFMSGPLKDLSTNAANKTATEAVSNSILGYLLGYTTDEDQPQESDSEGPSGADDVLSEKEQAAEKKMKE